VACGLRKLGTNATKHAPVEPKNMHREHGHLSFSNPIKALLRRHSMTPIEPKRRHTFHCAEPSD
jgi:hypothetical protein